MAIKRRSNGFLSNMGSRKLLDYTFREYGRKISPTDLSKKDQVLYQELLKRKLNGKLKRTCRPAGFFGKMNDDELLAYTFRKYGRDIFPTKLKTKDGSLYLELWKRKLTNELEKKKGPNGFFSEASDRKLLEYTLKEYGEKITREKLYYIDAGLYRNLRIRGILNKIKKVHIITNGQHLKNGEIME